MKPLILVTNDDGVFSPGLIAAAEAVEPLGEVLIAAPRFQQTSMSRSYPKGDNMGIIESLELIINGKKHVAYGIHGSPALVVSHAILEIATRKLDLCVSGINYGENVGLGILASGTVGAALEADTYDIPSIAVSLEADMSTHHSDNYNKLQWGAAVHFTRYFAERVLREGLPKEVALLNINVPSNATAKTKVQLAKQSRQNYFIFKQPEKRDFSRSFRFQVELEIIRDTLEPDSDIYALVNDRVVSVTPIGWNLTTQLNWVFD